MEENKHTKKEEAKSGGNLPAWMGRGGISETRFAADYLLRHPMRVSERRFYTTDGIITDEEPLEADIFRELEPHVPRGIIKTVHRVLDVMRAMAYSPAPPVDENVIHVQNGTYSLTDGFREEKEYCINRLPVRFNPEAPLPEVWLAFLAELLEPEDIATLQEYMGYCLIPSSRAQKMLMVIGEGGEGKSRIGLVMRALLGENMNMGNLAKIEINQFARADLVHKLLLVDDDLPLEALPSTNYIKSIISAEGKMDVEQKGKQSVQAVMYCRFLGFGNGAISAMHDRSRGFFRRQIILRAKSRPAGRKDQPFLIDYLLEEKEGIFLWCLSGLRRLRKNNYSFTLSETAKKNLADAAKDSNNILEFMRSEGYIEKNPEWYATSKQLCRAYAKWCDDNACHAFADRTLIAYLREHQERYGIVYTNKIPNGETFVRGFAGMRVRV